MDSLLLALSRRREVSWPTFKAHVAEIVGGPWSASSVLNGLVACGHATATFEGGTGVVCVAPRVLAGLPHRPVTSAVLVGHRTAETERSLRDAAGAHGAECIVGDDDDCPFAPRRLSVSGSLESLQQIAAAVNALFHPDPAAWRVVQYAGTLADYRSRLEWLPRPDLSGWNRRRFDPDVLQFLPADAQRDGLVEFSHPATGRRLYWYRQDGQVAEVDRDWGRYLALEDAGRTTVLSLQDGGACAPLGALPPGPLATAFGLCSGRPPTLVRSAPTWSLVYREVPPEIAERVARKLAQTLTLPLPPAE